MRQKRTSSGFTIFELVTVVAIITVLISGIMSIPWGNIISYARSSAADQIEATVAGARMLAMERGRRAAVIFSQSDQTDAALMTTVIESDTPNTFWSVDGVFPASLPRATTVRAPEANAAGNSLYQTSLGGSSFSDNVVSDPLPTLPGHTKQVKCFAVAFDSQGRLIVSGRIAIYDANRSGIVLSGGTVEAGDLINIPMTPYVGVVGTRSLTDAKALCFQYGQATEDNFILNAPSTLVKFIAFNRYSGNALRRQAAPSDKGTTHVMHPSLHSPHRRQGFTLPEVLLAMALLAMGMSSILLLFPIGARMQAQARNDTAGRSFAQAGLAAVQANANLFYASGLLIDGHTGVTSIPFTNLPTIPIPTGNFQYRACYWQPLINGVSATGHFDAAVLAFVPSNGVQPDVQITTGKLASTSNGLSIIITATIPVNGLGPTQAILVQDTGPGNTNLDVYIVHVANVSGSLSNATLTISPALPPSAIVNDTLSIVYLPQQAVAIEAGSIR